MGNTVTSERERKNQTHLPGNLTIKNQSSSQPSFTDGLGPVNLIPQHQHRHVGDGLVSQESLDGREQRSTDQSTDKRQSAANGGQRLRFRLTSSSVLDSPSRSGSAQSTRKTMPFTAGR